jgi:transposase
MARGKYTIDEQLALSLACGATIEAAAAKLKVSTSTVNRRLKDPKFQKRLREVRSDMVARATSMLTAAAMEAVKTLLALQSTETPPPVRLGAARAVLELGSKLRESIELSERVTALEAQFGQSA